MKANRSHASFIENLKRQMKHLRRMKPDEVHVFTINANYGRYQIIIGPGKGHQRRNLEINGNIHHLFISPKNITPNPSSAQIHGNLKDTVILRDLNVHLVDPCGDGKKLSMKKCDSHPRELINLAGKRGKTLLSKVELNGRLSRVAYRIIQDDILRSLRKEGGKSA